MKSIGTLLLSIVFILGLIWLINVIFFSNTIDLYRSDLIESNK